jgi:hypothetical protein
MRTRVRRLADKRAAPGGERGVENKLGAPGIAVTVLKDSPADGSALLLTPSSAVVDSPGTPTRRCPTSRWRMQPVSLARYVNHAFGVGPAVPASVKDMKDFSHGPRPIRQG